MQRQSQEKELYLHLLNISCNATALKKERLPADPVARNERELGGGRGMEEGTGLAHVLTR